MAARSLTAPWSHRQGYSVKFADRAGHSANARAVATPHLSVKPDMPPTASAHRCPTLVTRPGRVVASASCTSNALHRPSAPSATTLTRPSARFSAKPVRPSSSAFARTHQRNPTPCTRPSTQAVSRVPPLPSTSPPAVSRPWLAVRAGVGGPVHERISPDRCATARAWLAFPAVYGERPVKVPALPVDVHIEAVEAGPAILEGLS